VCIRCSTLMTRLWRPSVPNIDGCRQPFTRAHTGTVIVHVVARTRVWYARTQGFGLGWLRALRGRTSPQSVCGFAATCCGCMYVVAHLTFSFTPITQGHTPPRLVHVGTIILDVVARALSGGVRVCPRALGACGVAATVVRPCVCPMGVRVRCAQTTLLVHAQHARRHPARGPALAHPVCALRLRARCWHPCMPHARDGGAAVVGWWWCGGVVAGWWWLWR
jgi:hypothetical protein